MNWQIIKLYPTISSRLYVFFRSLILPIDLIETYLPKNGKILDVGCGFGYTSIFFATKSKLRQVFGIELDNKRVDLAKHSSRYINNVHFAVENLADNSTDTFDAVVLIDLLHHISGSEKDMLLSECYKLIKPSGIMIIKDIDTIPKLKYLWNYLHDLIMTGGDTLNFIGHNDLIKLLKSHHFIVTKHYPIKNLLYPHYLYVCHKK